MGKVLLTIAFIMFTAGCATAPETMPVSRPAAPDMSHPIARPIGLSYPSIKEPFVWPVNGNVVAFYGAKTARGINKGIDISAREGSSIRASRAGRIVYCDPHFKGFGKTVIVDHGDGYQTVYSYNSDILVRVGDMVKRSDVIAKVGRTGRAKEPMLHFEIRLDGEPQNPYYYIQR